MRRRLLVGRRNAHQTRYFQTVLSAAHGDERIGLFGRDACFLRFTAGIDLNEETRPPSAVRHGFRQRFSQPRPVESFNDIEKFDGVLRLVALERTDQV